MGLGSTLACLCMDTKVHASEGRSEEDGQAEGEKEAFRRLRVSGGKTNFSVSLLASRVLWPLFPIGVFFP